MERLYYPIPINPNAKYLSNSISNVLYSIQKFDQNTLAWPTCQPRKVIARFKKRSSPEVPLAGTASSVIQNKGRFVSSGDARAAKKNTFYQILLASQDQPPFEEPRRFKRKKNDAQFKRDSKDDSIYSDIYDIVRTHSQYKRQPRYESPPPERHISITETPPVMEVYKIRPLATENRETKSNPKSPKVKYPKVDNYKLQDRTNELSNSKGPQSKPKSSTSKTSKKEFIKFLSKDNKLKAEMHRSKSHPTKDISRGRERIIQTSIKKDKLKEKSKTKCNFPATQDPVKDVQEVRERYEKTRYRKSLESRKSSIDLGMTAEMYQEKLRRVKQFLNREDIFDGTHTGSSSMSIDIEGIQDRDLLLYPYPEIYEKKINVTIEKESNVNEKIVTESKVKSKPPDGEIENVITNERKTACIMCRTIKRSPADEEAPFMEAMRKEQRRRELLAYRANIETQGEPCKISVPLERSDQYIRTGPISLNDLSRKELYSLESRTILFSEQRNFISFPKKSNQIIFLGESDSITFLKKCNSITFPKESNSIICF
nr:uncharacterized protein LOC108067661 [Drosophila takahashii]